MQGNIKGNPALISIFASRLPGLEKRADSYWAKCVFHPDQNPSLSVGKDTKGDWVYHCFGCLPIDEEIWTENGLQPLKTVLVGMKVIDRYGNLQPVLGKEIKNRNLLCFSSGSFRKDPLKVSYDHLCLFVKNKDALSALPYLYRDSKRGTRLKTEYKRKYKTKNIPITEAIASEVKVGDFFLFPVIAPENRVTNHLENSLKPYIRGPRTDRISKLFVNKDCAYLYGLWLAEGHAQERACFFTYNLNEKNTLARETKRILLEYYGLNSSLYEYPKKNTCVVACSKSDLSASLKYWFGSGAKNKKIPTEVLMWPVDIQKEFIRGYLDGDGEKKNGFARTVSKKLAYGLYALYIQCGIRPSLSRKDAYIDKTGLKHSEVWCIGKLSREGPSGFFQKIDATSYFWSIITEIEIGENEEVVDIRVANTNSFVTKLGIVHNCGVGGDAIQFIQEADKVDFKIAKAIVEKITGGDWEETKKLAEKTFKKLELGEVKSNKRYTLEEYAKFEISLYENQEAKDWLFTQRGITATTARKLHFGFCQSLESLNKKCDPSLEPVKDKGWIITPAVEGKEVVSIEARSMVEKKFSRKVGMDAKVLWGVDFIDWSQPLYLVEGKFDLAVMIQAGFCAVSLPSASTNITPQMRDLLMSASVLILAGDNDGGAGSDRMHKLWNELSERTFRLIWPDNKKDANQTFLEVSNRDIQHFKNLVEDLTLKAYGNPVPGVRSIQDILQNDTSESAESRTDRFKFSLKPLDKMANVLPGAVVYISASCTGTGKSTLVLQETIHSARKHDEIVLNWQTQLQGEEVATIVAANLIAKDRNLINKNDRLEAAKRLKNCLYYVGNDPNVATLDQTLDVIEAGVRRVGATTLVIDLLHDICQTEQDEIKAQNRAMRRIKLMAQKYLLKVFLVGQPRKVDPKNQGKPLGIYDSKGSEAVVSESDVVYFLHRAPVKVMTEEVFDKLSPEVEIHNMKARSKGTGAAFAKVFFLGKIATFREIVPIEEPMIDNRSFDF